MSVTVSAVKILLVDDNPKNIEAAMFTLESLGETVVTAGSGKAALKYLLEDEFAVILLDVNMPEMSGLETAELIRKSKKSELTPIIFVTAFDEGQSEILKAYSLGAVDYIVKPYVPEILLAKVQVFIDLYRMREELVLQKEQEAEHLRHISQKEQEAEYLRLTLESHNVLIGWQESSDTATVYGAGPLQNRNSKAFASLVLKYEALLDEYLEAIAFAEKPPSQKVSQIAESLGDLAAGPRDVVQLHINCVTNKTKDVNSKRARAYTTEGRLLALELMGYLVDFYRLQRPIHIETNK